MRSPGRSWLVAALAAAALAESLWACDDGGDGDADADTDADADADADADLEGDAGSGPPCSDYRGTCEALVGGCASCPSGTMPTAWETDCRTTEWCCEGREAGESACEGAGGVCLPVRPGTRCPEGWEPTAVDCGMGGSCCQPAAGCG